MTNWNNITFKRLKQEIISPTRNFTRKGLYIIHNLIYTLSIKIGKKKIEYLVYDVRNNPITFDIVFIIYYGYLFFLKQGIKNFKLIIFEPKYYQYNRPMLSSYSKYVSSADLKKRLTSMILPIAESFNCINSIEIISSYKDFEKLKINTRYIFPQFFNPRIYSPNVQNHKKIYFNLLKNKKKELYPYLISAFSKEEIISKISSQIKIIKYATITLRDYGFNPARNTSSKDIKIALSYAKSKGLSLILVPDEIKNLDNYEIPKEIIIYSRARESLKERVGLYSYSEINIFPPCGAANISLFTRSSKTIILKFGDPKSIDSSSKYYKETYNLNYGQQPYQGLKGYLDWYTNKYENLDYQIQIPRNFFDV